MSPGAFYPAALALAAGLTAQALAVRLGVPSIAILLGVGVLLGPDVLGALDPRVFGAARADLVSLAVTVILFEGGLALDVGWLRRQQRTLIRLLTTGALVSMVGAMLAARAVLGFSWSIAALYGTLMIVTGPTVVTPLLSRLTIDRPVRQLLVSEGVLIDPVGAIAAIVAAEYVVGHHAALASGPLVLLRLGIGAAAGGLAGMLLSVVLRRGWISEDLTNPIVLGIVLLVAAWASQVSAEAGLMAAVVLGIVLANAGVPGLRRLREFKEALTVVLLSFIFVVLAAGLRLREVHTLGWRGLAVVAILVWIARPLGVLVSTAGSELTLRQRAFIAWICPRGIVAAAVASFFHALLSQAKIPGGKELEALVFVTVAVTVTFQGLTARSVARLLGIDHPPLQGTIIVGADLFGRLLAQILLAEGRQVAVIDRSHWHCREARAAGLSVYEGDALSLDTLEEAGARYADTVIALTHNPELNALVAHRVHDNFLAQRVLAFTDDPKAADRARRSGLFPGDFPGIEEVNRLLRLGQLRVVEYEASAAPEGPRRLEDLLRAPGRFALVVRHGNSVRIASAEQTLGKGDRLWCGESPANAGALAETLTLVREMDVSRLRSAGRARPHKYP